VAVAVHEEEVGGATRALLRVQPLMRNKGWQFVFWAPSPSRLADELRADGHQVRGARRTLRYGWRELSRGHGVRANLAAVPGYLRSFRAFLDEEAPVLVHANSLLTLPEAAVARASGAAVLVHAHEPMPPPPKGPPARVVLALAAHAVIAPSRATARSVAGWRVRPAVVHNGLTVPGGPRRSVSRDGRPLVVGTVAAIAPRKGTDVLVEAARLVRAEQPSVVFRMLGDYLDDADADWARRVLDRARAVGVEWTARADVWSELPRWDAFVLASRRDPFPLAVLEAMACGVPVVGSAVGGLVDTVVHGQTGVHVPPRDPRAIAVVVNELLNSPSVRAQLGRAGAARVRSRYTWERVAASTEHVYDAMSRRPATSLEVSQS
jgi:glycosyltransferase involved in cell wall biosynthesis